MKKDNIVNLTSADHEVKTQSGIIVADPDQGLRHVVLALDIQGQIDVWEPFEDGTEGGHNLIGFLRRWDAFRASDAAHLQVMEPRFGHPCFITRNAIERVNWIGLGIRRKEDTRAGVRGLALPANGGVQTRRLPDGNIEVLIPR